jgi:CRISPR-associated endonuclease Csn1
MTRFGLDIGTQSIGWCVLDIDDDKSALVDLGVRVFSDSREPSSDKRIGDPLNVNRRVKRAMRRNLERRKRRRAAMFRLLKECGYIPSDSVGYSEWEQLDPYEIRDRGRYSDLSKEELSRVLLQLAARRGFKSNRKTDKKDSELKGQALRQDNLGKLLGDKTLGSWQHEALDKINESRRNGGGFNGSGIAAIRFKPGTPFYPTRAMYLDEFQKLRERQERKHPNLDWDRIERIIFFQRPLKRPERGHCEFYQEELRAYGALPSAQRFRMLQDINNLAYPDAEGKTRFLTTEQKNKTWAKVSTAKTLSFDQIRKDFGIEAPFNLESKTRDGLKGDSVSYEMRKPACFGKRWDEISLERRDEIVEALLVEDDEEILKGLLRSDHLDESEIEKVLSVDIPVGVASVSSRFMRECSDIMESRWIGYSDAVAAMGMHHSDRAIKVRHEKLPYYGEILSDIVARADPSAPETRPEEKYGRIANPTVHVALNQVRKVVNALTEEYGKPSEIVLEVARDLKKGRKALEEAMKKQRENYERNRASDRMIREITKSGADARVSRMDRKRFQLWSELADGQLGNKCVYCGKPISAAQVFNGQAEIEHILPFSRTLDDSMSNLTISHKSCNNAKGNRTPYEAFGNSPSGFSWPEIQERAWKFPRKKIWRFNEDAMDRFSGENDFIASQLTDTAYIAKAARDYLSVLCDPGKVWASPGRLTASLRDKWDLNACLNRNGDRDFKNRSDHRHHAIDAIVIGLCDRSMMNKASRMNALTGTLDGRFKVPDFPLDRAEIKKRLAETLVSRKPDHGLGGQLFNETAYGWIRRPQESGADERAAVVRKPVASLTPAELNGRAAIVDPGIARRIQEFLNENGVDTGNKKKLEEALQGFSEKTGIRRVRVAAKNSAGLRVIKMRDGEKRYQYSDVAYADIWMLPGKKGKPTYEANFIYRAEAEEAIKKPLGDSRPHPAAKHVARLFKGDPLAIHLPDRIVWARVAGYSTTQNKVDLQPLHSAGSIAEWLKSTNINLIDRYWTPKDDHNFISVNVLFSLGKVSIPTISPLGKTKRR